ncbi:MAG: transglutaminase domain-containing protein [Dehalococcoidia bacterium]|nr:transglutaminase domain-containing protein [Dehalococcoidia bacterium]
MEDYLRCTNLIDYDRPDVGGKANELTRGLETNREKAVALFYFVRDSIRFNPYSPGHLLELNAASAVLGRGHGFCYQKAILLVAMARSSGIPARLGFADIRNHLLSKEFTEMMGGSNILVYHGFAEFLLNGRWVAATPAYDLKLCRDNGYVPVEFDGVNDARLHKHAADGRLHIEYIRDHGHRPDLPWEEILRARDEFVAGLGMEVADFMARWEQISKSG